MTDPEPDETAEFDIEPGAAEVDAAVRELTGALVEVLGGEPPDPPIGPGTTLFEDIGLESIEFAALAGRLRTRHGDGTGLAEVVAALDIDEFADLTVADLARRIAAARLVPSGEEAHA